jgi:transposase
MSGMDWQTLRDWVHRFNEHGPEGLRDSWSKGNRPVCPADQETELARLIETGPDMAVPGRPTLASD